MKNTAFKPGNLVIALFFAIYLWAGWSQSTFSQRFATQDLILFDSLNVDDGIGNTVNLADSLIAIAQANPKDTAHFPGGGMFINTDSLWGDVVNDSLYTLINTTVQCGFFQYTDSIGATQLKFGMLTTSNLTYEPETMGNGDYLEVGLEALNLPSLQIGDTGGVIFAFIQFLAFSDTTLETLKTDIGLLELRAQDSSLVQFFSIDSVHCHLIKSKWRYCDDEKGRMSIKANVKFSLTDSNMVSSGVITSIGMGNRVSGIEAMEANLEGDESIEPDVSIIPVASSLSCNTSKKDGNYSCIDKFCNVLGGQCVLYTIERQTDNYVETIRYCACELILNGAEEPTQPWKWSIVPNPSNLTPEILLQSMIPLEVTLQIFDLHGQVVWDSGAWQTSNGEKMYFHPSKLAPGIYLVKLESNHSPAVEVRRMIIVP